MVSTPVLHYKDSETNFQPSVKQENADEILHILHTHTHVCALEMVTH